MVTKLLIPFFAGGSLYDYWYYDQIGADAAEVIRNLVGDPVRFFALFFDKPAKIMTLAAILVSGGFFLFLKPQYGLQFLPFILMKVYACLPRLWEPSYHYLLVAAIPLAFAVFLFLGQKLKEYPDQYLQVKIIAVAIVGFTIITTFLLPFYNGLRLRQIFSLSYYEIGLKSQGRLALAEAKKILPGNETICCQSNLCPHLQNKQIVTLFPYREGLCDYMVIDKKPTRTNDLVIPDEKPMLTTASGATRHCELTQDSEVVDCGWKKEENFHVDMVAFQLLRLEEKLQKIKEEEGFDDIFSQDGIFVLKRNSPKS